MRSKGGRIGWLYILAIALMTSPSVAQNPPPAAPNAQRQAPEGCRIPRSDILTASIVQATGESLQRKNWQAQGGVIQFTVKSVAAMPDKASFFVCFRWKTTPENTDQFDQTRPERLDRNNDGTTWTVTTTIPHNLTPVPDGKVLETVLPFVPLADVRVIAVKEDKTLAADAVTTIGITYPWVAILIAIATILVALVGLSIITNLRLEHEGIKRASWFLRIISTPSGYASLSQLQIVLWTLVVAASAVYVMVLSGELIAVTNGTLVLLGIAGAAALGAKAHGESQSSAAQAAAVTAQQKADQAKIDAAKKTAETSAVQAEKDVAKNNSIAADKMAEAATARAKAFTNPPDSQAPKWSDLIVTEIPKVDGTVTREIDVVRFQMLLFTLITAAFVVMNVLTTYVIPEIPTGFLTLMGISNGVYLGAKVVQVS